MPPTVDGVVERRRLRDVDDQTSVVHLSSVVATRLWIVALQRRPLERGPRNAQLRRPKGLVGRHVGRDMNVESVASRRLRDANQIEPGKEETKDRDVTVDELDPAVSAPWLVLAALSPVEGHPDDKKLAVGETSNRLSAPVNSVCHAANCRLVHHPGSFGARFLKVLLPPSFQSGRRSDVAHPQADRAIARASVIGNLRVRQTLSSQPPAFKPHGGVRVAAPSARWAGDALQPVPERVISHVADESADLVVGFALAAEEPGSTDPMTITFIDHV